VAFSRLDLAVVIAYLIAITAFGAHFRKSQHTLRDYFLGGRRLPWWAIAFSVVSAETSILTIVSVPGIAYRSNLTFLQLVLGYLVARVVVSFVLLRRYFAGELYTAYQLVEKLFGRGLKVFTAALFLTTRALAEGVRVVAISMGIEVIVKAGVLASVFIISLLTFFYNFECGLCVVVGVALFAFYRHFPPSTPFSRVDRIFPTFVATQLPRGLAGLLIAAILAAAMSNLSAAFNSLASTSVVDFYKPFVRPSADE